MIHDLAFQEKSEAKKKHDFVVSGSLAYIFFSKHYTYKTMIKHLVGNEEKQVSKMKISEGNFEGPNPSLKNSG